MEVETIHYTSLYLSLRLLTLLKWLQSLSATAIVLKPFVPFYFLFFVAYFYSLRVLWHRICSGCKTYNPINLFIGWKWALWHDNSISTVVFPKWIKISLANVWEAIWRSLRTTRDGASCKMALVYLKFWKFKPLSANVISAMSSMQCQTE